MLRTKQYFAAAITVMALGLACNSFSQVKKPSSPKDLPKVGSAPAVLWRNPKDLTTRDLFYGPGGTEHAPKGKLTFIEEKFNGTNPKFDVHDGNDVRWGVKMGREARPETAATRLVWAMGYFVDEDYYLRELPVKGLPTLRRGQDLIQQGKIHGVRLKRHNPGEHTVGNWHWDSNPFAGSRELNGLKIVMELINNTDFKTEHLIIHDVNGTEQRYMITDLGASFGRAGAGYFNRTKGVLKDFNRYPLIQKAGPDYVDFWYFKHIPRADAKWIGGLLGQLSEQQINDAFRAGGFKPEEVSGFTKKVQEKIKELNDL